jgi:Phage P22-like portal protein
MAQDKHQKAKERWSDASEHLREQHARMMDDMRFSNPAEPRQWDDQALKLRKGRPCLTFDRTNQFIAQVVNDGRQNKPSIHCLPADSEADPEVAEKLNGIVRHIEYTSRAGIAYDTALEHAARVGLGWIRVIPEVMRPETNEQEIRIKRVHDPLSVKLDPNSTEPDGSDAMWGFVETTYTNAAFDAAFPKKKRSSWDSEGWFGEDSVRVCEYFYIEETTKNRIIASMMGQEFAFTEDEYWQVAQTTGVKPRVVRTEQVPLRSVKWCKLSGLEVLEETDFPSQYLPLIPVMGYEMWIEGKRYLCGMTRRMMDSQRFHNFAISAAYENMAQQPKAPFLLDERSVEGHEDEWSKLNSGNPAWLPYNGVDDQGNPLPQPSRLAPPQLSTGFAGLLEYSSTAMEASVGMFRANLGQSGNETSGRAIMARQREGDTANFHYLDNLNRSIEQLGRVIVDMIPRIYDTKRMARIVGEDGEQDFVQVNPEMGQAAMKEGRKVVAINPGVGSYDVRVKAGPSYTTLRQETAEQLSQMLQAAPNLLPILGDVWVRMQDWPEADKVAKRLKAMLPPQLQQLEAEDGPEIPPQVMGQMQAMQEQLAQLQQALQMAGQEVQKAQQEAISAKFHAEKASLDSKAKDLRLQEQQAIARVNEAIAAGQPQPEAPGVPPELQQMAQEVDEGLKEISHARELLKKDEQIALLRIDLAQKDMTQSVQQASQPQEPTEVGAEDSGEEEVELIRDEGGNLLGAKIRKVKAQPAA